MTPPAPRHQMGFALAVLLSSGLLAFALVRPEISRNLLESAITLWWNRMVPIVFPALVFAGTVLYIPTTLPIWGAVTLYSLFSFPLVGAHVALTAYDQKKIYQEQVYALIPYANLYNPFLLPNPHALFRLDLCLMASAFLVSQRLPSNTLNRTDRPTESSLVLEAMNWTTVLGAMTAFAVILQGLGLGNWVPVLTEPLTPHWTALHTTPLWVVFFLGTNGLVTVLPVLFQAHALSLSIRRIIRDRLLQAFLATLLFGLLSQLLA